MIHISELAEGIFLHPRNVVKQGQWIVAKALSSVSGKNRRIVLMLRGTAEQPE